MRIGVGTEGRIVQKSGIGRAPIPQRGGKSPEEAYKVPAKGPQARKRLMLLEMMCMGLRLIEVK